MAGYEQQTRDDACVCCSLTSGLLTADSFGSEIPSPSEVALAPGADQRCFPRGCGSETCSLGLSSVLA